LDQQNYLLMVSFILKKLLENIVKVSTEILVIK